MLPTDCERKRPLGAGDPRHAAIASGPAGGFTPIRRNPAIATSGDESHRCHRRWVRRPRGTVLGIFPDVKRWADCACIAGAPATDAYVREEALITNPCSLITIH